MKQIADPVTTEVVRNFVNSCAEDMNAALWHSAYSAVIYEGARQRRRPAGRRWQHARTVDGSAAVHWRHRCVRPSCPRLLR